MAIANIKPGVVGRWYSDFQAPLRRFLARRRAGSSADIDDISQEVFLRLLRFDRAELVEHPQAYLFKIAANVSAEWSLRSRQRLPHDSAWLDELVDSMSPEAELEKSSRNVCLSSALEALPRRAFQILNMHFGDGMTHPQIALKLGVSRKIVKRDMARAYALLRATLDQKEMSTSECINQQSAQ